MSSVWIEWKAQGGGVLAIYYVLCNMTLHVGCWWCLVGGGWPKMPSMQKTQIDPFSFLSNNLNSPVPIREKGAKINLIYIHNAT